MSQTPSHGSDAAVAEDTRAAAHRHPGALAVLGMGQLGGSIALAGRAAGLFSSVVGFGRRSDSLARALALGLCDRATTSAADAVSQAEIVVLATPLRAIPEIVDAIAPTLRPGALIMDVGSVKGTAERDIEARLPSTVSFVGCHPLAGTEQFGPEAARVDLFRGRRCLICPTPRTPADALDRARHIWEALGAEVLTMQPELHDKVMAAVSHLPHVAAYVLAAALGDLPPEVELMARALPTTSLRDTSRVAASSSAMWKDIFLENAPALLPLIDELSVRLDALKQAIATGDERRLLALLDAGRAVRQRLLPE